MTLFELSIYMTLFSPRFFFFYSHVWKCILFVALIISKSSHHHSCNRILPHFSLQHVPHTENGVEQISLSFYDGEGSESTTSTKTACKLENDKKMKLKCKQTKDSDIRKARWLCYSFIFATVVLCNCKMEIQ